jgi:hypothetical protein
VNCIGISVFIFSVVCCKTLSAHTMSTLFPVLDRPSAVVDVFQARFAAAVSNSPTNAFTAFSRAVFSDAVILDAVRTMATRLPAAVFGRSGQISFEFQDMPWKALYGLLLTVARSSPHTTNSHDIFGLRRHVVERVLTDIVDAAHNNSLTGSTVAHGKVLVRAETVGARRNPVSRFQTARLNEADVLQNPTAAELTQSRARQIVLNSF